MTAYDDLIKELREQAEHYCKHCSEKVGEYLCGYKGDQYCGPKALLDAADAIEKLTKGHIFTGFALSGEGPIKNIYFGRDGKQELVMNIDLSDKWRVTDVLTNGMYRGETHDRLVMVLAREEDEA